MTTNIILTKGIYDLIKDHVRRKKVTKEQEEILTKELKTAKQILRCELSEEIVSVNRSVLIKNTITNEEATFNFVGPKRAKAGKNRHSILNEVGLATVGYKTGDTVKWPTENGEKIFEILKVTSTE